MESEEEEPNPEWWLASAGLGGAVIVGIAGELSVALLAWLGRPTVLGLDNPTAYRPVAAFVIMILVLLLRPAGLGGRRGPTLRTRRILRVPRWAKRERAQ